MLFYHSSCPEPGIAGIAEVASAAYPDKTQFDRKSPYYDPKSKKDTPRWVNVDVRALRKTRLMPLAELREHKRAGEACVLAAARATACRSRPVTESEWKFIARLV